MLVTCPHCNGGLENRPDIANTLVGCPRCGKRIQLPPYANDAPQVSITPKSSSRSAKKQESALASIITVLIVTGLMAGCVITCSGIGKYQGTANESSRVAAGEKGKLSVGGGDILICRTVEAYNQLSESIAAKDTGIFTELLRSGSGFAVEDGTEVLLISPGIMRAEVRVLKGPQAGQRGFVAPEFIVKP